MRLICFVSLMGTVCTTQNTSKSLPDVQRNVKGILCVYLETLLGFAGRCGTPEVQSEKSR